MKIACYAIAFNEEVMLPHFINHYKPLCDKIVIYDNMSTDSTKEMALDHGCEVIQWEAPGGGLNDQNYLDIKSSCYKKDRSDYDWVMVVDIDEHFTHLEGTDKFLSTLEEYTKLGINLPSVQGYNMFSWDHDLTKPLTDIVHAAPSESYSKNTIFNPSLDLEWNAGCHGVSKVYPEPKASDSKEIVLKHYKFINYEWVVDRHEFFGKRLSNYNKTSGLGIQYTWSKEKYLDYFKSLEKEIVTLN